MHGGWVGISESEGENAARAWFVRSDPNAPRPSVIDAGWNDEQLTDASDGTRILTTDLEVGRITVRLFPTLDVIREIGIEGEELHLGACFVGSHVVARLYNRQATVAIDTKGGQHDLDVDDGWLVPAAGNSWLSVSRDGVRRWTLT